MSTPFVLQVKDVNHGYTAPFGTRRDVLAQIDLNVAAREGVVLMGANGAGKSTLLLLIANLRRLQQGRIELFGQPHRASSARRALGILPDRPSLPLRRTPRALLDHLGRLYRMPPEQRTERIAAVFRSLQLTHLGDIPIGSLSAGQQHRVALAQAIVHEPALLLLDEPLAALDPESTEAVVDTLVNLRRRGTAMLIASHRVPTLSPVANRCVAIQHGKLLELGTVEEVMAISPAFVLFAMPAGERPPQVGQPLPATPPLYKRWVSATQRDRLLHEVRGRGGRVLRVEPDTRNFSTSQADIQETLA